MVLQRAKQPVDMNNKMKFRNKKKQLISVILNTLILTIMLSFAFGGEKDIGVRPSKKSNHSIQYGLPGRYAVVVGISQYKNSSFNLKYADKDAIAFYDFLLRHEGGGFRKENVKLLLNDEATSSALRTALGTFLANTSKQDYVIIYFSGHGSPTFRNRDDLYLLTYESDPSNLAGTAFPMDEVKRYLQKSIFAGRVVMITDTCYSGGIRLMGPSNSKNDNYLANYLSKLTKSRPGMVSITASGDSQLSVENRKYGGGHGIFTYYFLKGLTEDARLSDSNKDAIVDVAEIFTYVRERVKKETQDMQVPHITGNLLSGIPLSAVRNWRPFETERPLSVIFGMFKDVKGRSPIKVSPDDTIYSGDGYFFYIKASRSCYIYLFQADSTGSVYRLFPNNNYNTINNFAPADKQVILPNEREVYYLDNTIGKEEIYLFASTQKNPYFEVLGLGKRINLEAECMRLMGPSGVRNRKQTINNRRLDMDIILKEVSSKNGFVHVMEFMHE